MMRNFAGSQVGATGFDAEGFKAGDFKAEGFKLACFRSARFAACRFGEAAGFAAAVDLSEAAGLGDGLRLGD
jgi:hypothetical protein